ncbi:hypothetical protein BG004_003657 [Podila humilis]|nr:hypothetical protein BG004_003657 [Podila humilis]
MYSQQGKSSQSEHQHQGQGQQGQNPPPLYYYPQTGQQQQYQYQYDYSQYHHPQQQQQQQQQHHHQYQQQQYAGYQGYQQYQHTQYSQQQQQYEQPQQTSLQGQLAAALAPISGLLGGQSTRSTAATPSLGLFPRPSLPPSYNTPLPPSKPNGYTNGARSRKPSMGGSNINNASAALGQMQTQNQYSMQMGAAAASAATSALFAHGYTGNGGMSGNDNGGSVGSAGGEGEAEDAGGGGGAEWYSSYQTPTNQQRMAVTLSNPQGGAEGQPTPYGQKKHNKNNNHNNNYNNNRRPYSNNINTNASKFRQNIGRNGRNNDSQRGNPHQNQNKQSTTATTASIEQVKDAIGFHCDACDVTFHEAAKLKIHLAAHRICPDCQYAASPSLVADHRKLTHGPKNTTTTTGDVARNVGEDVDDDNDGDDTSDSSSIATNSTIMTNIATSTAVNNNYKNKTNIIHPRQQQQLQKTKKPFIQEPGLPKLPSLDTPEDIANWIAQRRKAWPTESNILKKEQEKQEMIAKGQIVQQTGTKGRNQRGRQDNNSNNNNNNNNNNNKRKRGDEITSPPAVVGQVVMAEGENSAVSVDANGAKKSKTQLQPQPQEHGDIATPSSSSSIEGLVSHSAPSTLQSDVEDEQNDGDENEDMDFINDAVSSKDPSVIGKILLPNDRQRPKRPCRYFMRGRCGKGDKCTYSHDPSLKNKTQSTQKANATASNRKELFRARPSLLQMLLSGEIKEEKNVLLEAMRYIVDNNFFDRQEPVGALVEEVVMDTA